MFLVHSAFAGRIIVSLPYATYGGIVADAGTGKSRLCFEFLEHCREQGMRVGFYYSLMDWHHPDGHNCATDADARKRFLEYTKGCVRELCTNYGKIDILW